jgi:hydrogenase nickel incorporation protein HypA/HybF
MHEWALAEGVVITATMLAEERGLRRVTEVVVRVGELQQIEHDILLFALEQLKTPLLNEAKFTLEKGSAILRCRVCGEEWEFSPEDLSEDVSEAIHFLPEVAHSYIECPSCGSPDFEVVEGRGVVLVSIRGIGDDE